MADRENMGPEVFEGVPAYRLRNSRKEERRGALDDMVISDERSMQVGQTTWREWPVTEDEMRLTHIVLGEPSPALFDAPEGVRRLAAHTAENPK